MTSDAREYSGQDPSEQQPSPEGQDRFERLLDGLLRPQDSLRGQQQQLWACLQSMKSLTAAVVQQLASEPLSLAWQTIGHRQVLSDLRALQAWLLSLELLCCSMYRRRGSIMSTPRPQRWWVAIFSMV